MKTKRFLKWLIAIFVAINVYSLIPIASFYLKKSSPVKMVNGMVVEKLKGNTDPYFSFIVISDTGSGLFLNEASTLKLVSRINREDRFKKIPIDFVINVGDVTFRGRESHYENYMKI